MLKKLFGNLLIDLIVALLVMAIGAYTFRHPSSPLVKYFEAQKAAEQVATPAPAPTPVAVEVPAPMKEVVAAAPKKAAPVAERPKPKKVEAPKPKVVAPKATPNAVVPVEDAEAAALKALAREGL